MSEQGLHTLPKPFSLYRSGPVVGIVLDEHGSKGLLPWDPAKHPGRFCIATRGAQMIIQVADVQPGFTGGPVYVAPPPDGESIIKGWTTLPGEGRVCAGVVTRVHKGPWGCTVELGGDLFPECPGSGGVVYVQGYGDLVQGLGDSEDDDVEPTLVPFDADADRDVVTFAAVPARVETHETWHEYRVTYRRLDGSTGQGGCSALNDADAMRAARENVGHNCEILSIERTRTHLPGGVVRVKTKIGSLKAGDRIVAVCENGTWRVATTLDDAEQTQAVAVVRVTDRYVRVWFPNNERTTVLERNDDVVEEWTEQPTQPIHSNGTRCETKQVETLTFLAAWDEAKGRDDYNKEAWNAACPRFNGADPSRRRMSFGEWLEIIYGKPMSMADLLLSVAELAYTRVKIPEARTIETLLRALLRATETPETVRERAFVVRALADDEVRRRIEQVCALTFQLRGSFDELPERLAQQLIAELPEGWFVAQESAVEPGKINGFMAYQITAHNPADMTGRVFDNEIDALLDAIARGRKDETRPLSPEDAAIVVGTRVLCRRPEHPLDSVTSLYETADLSTGPAWRMWREGMAATVWEIRDIVQEHQMSRRCLVRLDDGTDGWTDAGSVYPLREAVTPSPSLRDIIAAFSSVRSVEVLQDRCGVGREVVARVEVDDGFDRAAFDKYLQDNVPMITWARLRVDVRMKPQAAAPKVEQPLREVNLLTPPRTATPMDPAAVTIVSEWLDKLPQGDGSPLWIDGPGQWPIPVTLLREFFADHTRLAETLDRAVARGERAEDALEKLRKHSEDVRDEWATENATLTRELKQAIESGQEAVRRERRIAKAEGMMAAAEVLGWTGDGDDDDPLAYIKAEYDEWKRDSAELELEVSRLETRIAVLEGDKAIVVVDTYGPVADGDGEALLIVNGKPWGRARENMTAAEVAAELQADPEFGWRCKGVDANGAILVDIHTPSAHSVATIALSDDESVADDQRPTSWPRISEFGVHVQETDHDTFVLSYKGRTIETTRNAGEIADALMSFAAKANTAITIEPRPTTDSAAKRTVDSLLAELPDVSSMRDAVEPGSDVALLLDVVEALHVEVGEVADHLQTALNRETYLLGQLARAKQLRDDARAFAQRRTIERDTAERERDAAARELVRVLAEREHNEPAPTGETRFDRLLGEIAADR
jgi:hypothetical protein